MGLAEGDNGIWLPYWTSLQMLGRLAPYYSTVAARNLAKETANAIELEADAHHFANVKADV